MKKKKVITITIVALILIAGIGYLVSQKGTKPSTQVNKPQTTNSDWEKAQEKSRNQEKFYYDDVYYHRDKDCKNRKGFISSDKYFKSGLLDLNKKPCPVCIPEEKEEQKEGK
jgi:hypothetical protein